METDINSAFAHRKYFFRKKFFKIFGGAFHVYDEAGNVVFYSEKKAFKLKEDFRIYSDESQSRELLTIKTPQIFDISATYNVRDATTGEPVGSIKREGLKSFLKDEWTFLSNGGHEMGKMSEESMGGALLSRFIKLIPQNYVITANNRTIAKIEQEFNPFILKYILTIDDNSNVDRRLLIAAGILLAGIEGRQR